MRKVVIFNDQCIDKARTASTIKIKKSLDSTDNYLWYTLLNTSYLHVFT